MCRAAGAFYAASQALGRYRIARGLAGSQHGAAEDRRIYDPDGPHPGRTLWSADGSGYSGVAPAGCTRGVSRAQLPHIDLILLSHAHFDHFDLATLRSLERAGTAVVTAKYTSDLLRVRRYQSVQEVGWDERVRVGPLSILGLRVKHWGARMRSDVHRGYNGYLIETRRHRVVFGGDTAWTDSFKTVRAAKPVDLAIMPIGAYDPWIHVHCNPEEAWRMGADCGAEHLLPVHHQTFRLSREPYLEPVERFIAGGWQPSRPCSGDARGARMVARP